MSNVIINIEELKELPTEAELGTGSEYCNIPIDDSMIGTHFDSWIYKDRKFKIDSDWTKPDDIKLPEIKGLKESQMGTIV